MIFGSSEVRTNQDHNTPEAFLDVLREMGAIGLDPCSNPWSRVGAESYVAAHDGGDGLAVPWHLFGLTFVNPPYGRGQIVKWVHKAALEAVQGGEIVMLVPCSPETKWSKLADENCDARGVWAGRIPFIGAGGNGAKAPSSVFYWGPRRHLFAHVFEPHLARLHVAARRRVA